MLDVIVTGAGGFVGSALVRQLRQEGRSVFAMDRSHGDVAGEQAWQGIPAARALIHLAGRSYVPDSWSRGPDFIASNVLGTERALAYCRVHGAHMVYASAYVYGIPEALPLQEHQLARPNNPYAMSKFAAEQLCEFAARYQGLNATVLRIFNIFGPGQRPEFLIPSILRQVRGGDEVRVLDLKPRRDYVFLDDVVKALTKSLHAGPGFHRANIGSGVSYSVQEIIDIIQSEAGTQLPVVSEASERPQEIPDVRADISVAQQVLGWTPCWTFKDGVRHMLNGT